MEKLVTYNMMIEANGHRFGGDSEHWIYLTNLKAYNESVLLGVYLHFPFDSDDLDTAYKAIYIGNEFVDEYGYPYEEYFITDYDAPFSIEEYDSPRLLAEKYDSLEEYMGYPDEVIRVVVEDSNADINIIELDNTEMNDYEKLGYALVDSGYYDIPEHLTNYIDYESIGREYELNASGSFILNYYIEIL
ncbi:antirestriction protein ArdA [Enterococcus sp. BWT-B8]|uniref:antirestriction protein ArdA n=1 Tax=Enterococcus sp. BWT-B8 TaxID=2885157 RepID=UPI001E619BAC|nr:antirestriction protein ArdA [Enterococcus sp. BWT-B8]MCB5953256.1 antirestriction protein ArdA [Enterococcus sp. BWT-B8]